MSLQGENIQGEVGALLDKYFISVVHEGFRRYSGITMPDHFHTAIHRIRDFAVRPDDIWICTFPKSGTTWAQEMAWLIANDLDYDGTSVPLNRRSPFIDIPVLFKTVGQGNGEPILELDDPISFLESCPSPRVIKTHLPFWFLPKQLQDPNTSAKIINVTRNPKDVCISYFHHCRSAEGYTGSLEDFVKLFLAGAVPYGPLEDNVLSFWERRERPNILLLTYEDMKKDLAGAIAETAEFLGKTLTEEQVAALARRLSFEEMKVKTRIFSDEFLKRMDALNSASGHMMRQGRVGGWRKEMSPEMVRDLDSWQNKAFHTAGLSWQTS